MNKPHYTHPTSYSAPLHLTSPLFFYSIFFPLTPYSLLHLFLPLLTSPLLIYPVFFSSHTLLSLTSPSSPIRSEEVLNALAAVMPEIIGGSADLTGSNLTNLKVSYFIISDVHHV